jgi:hypothetical protein
MPTKVSRLVQKTPQSIVQDRDIPTRAVRGFPSPSRNRATAQAKVRYIEPRRKATADIGAPRSLMKTYRPGFCSRWRRRRARSSMPVSGWTDGIPFLSRWTWKRPYDRHSGSARRAGGAATRQSPSDDVPAHADRSAQSPPPAAGTGRSALTVQLKKFPLPMMLVREDGYCPGQYRRTNRDLPTSPARLARAKSAPGTSSTTGSAPPS